MAASTYTPFSLPTENWDEPVRDGMRIITRYNRHFGAQENKQ